MTYILLCLIAWACSEPEQEVGVTITDPTGSGDTLTGQVTRVESPDETPTVAPVVVGAARLTEYLPQLRNTRVGLVVNQTSVVNGVHLVDTLRSLDVDIIKVFAPEHGFRGNADAGQSIKSGVDTRTGLPIVSLYGSHKKPTRADYEDLDLIVFDIQDVGARFYTYISTMHYIMEAAAEQDKKVLVLDRPNPNGHYVDGPVLREGFTSFVGMHRVPVVHGMTVGEYAGMLNGEGWLSGGVTCDLTVVPALNYDHNTFYALPIKPSPNLPDMQSIYLYPSLCFMEGTVVSVGRGTDKQFQIYGHPDFSEGDYTFTPEPMLGARSPKLQGKLCRGFDMSEADLGELQAQGLRLEYLYNAYRLMPEGSDFFLRNKFIDKLAGTDAVRKGILNGVTLDEMKASWQEDLTAFKEIRKEYLLYADFE